MKTVQLRDLLLLVVLAVGVIAVSPASARAPGFISPSYGYTFGGDQIGWTIGGGLIVFVNRHVGMKGDVRHYHAFDALEILGFDLAGDRGKLDFGRAAFGVVLKF